MATRCRPRAMLAGTHKLFYALDGSGEPVDGLLANEPFAECAAVQRFSVTPSRTQSTLETVMDKATTTRNQHGFFWCDICAGETEGHPRRDCSVSPLHVTGCWGRKGSYDLFSGPWVSAFVRALPGYMLVPSDFRDALTDVGFTGMCFTEWRLNVAQTIYSPGEIFCLEATGHNCVSPAEIVGGSNTCGLCGFGPVVCQECGHQWHTCPECQQEVFVSRGRNRSEAEQRILIESINRFSDHWQIDGSKWKGEDFVNLRGTCIVTRRIVDWLMDHRAGPWIAYPLNCELADVRPEQHEALLRAAGSRREEVELALSQVNRKY